MTKIRTDEFREIVEAEVFTSSEAAAYLGVSRQNLSQQTKAGRIPCIRGKLYLRADLDKIQLYGQKRTTQGRREPKTGRSYRPAYTRLVGFA